MSFCASARVIVGTLISDALGEIEEFECWTSTWLLPTLQILS